jgi:hypothetical protein
MLPLGKRHTTARDIERTLNPEKTAPLLLEIKQEGRTLFRVEV